ncbi:unnamed protein product [Effrenium voratum]|uniref:Uncharacterized protein n=1 Tax=Effrenium voratum TaxID=2562239 RepID=A0AA36HX67_9DINO|nr:unnamed protein product [Effrenium voratum]
MANEIDALIALDHPAIVRLIECPSVSDMPGEAEGIAWIYLEYFVEDSEVLLVMELLQGPSLGEKMREFGKFSESFAVRCLRHMLKALFCCHCHGIAHNDVSEENFRFENCRNDAALRMVDFGLSEVSSQESPLKPSEPGRGIYVQKRDIWSVGTILYQMLSGTRLLPVIKEGSESLGLLPCATNPNYVPAKLKQLEASEEALDLLSRMLEQGTEQRIAAQEALQHPLVVQSYALQQGQVDDPNPSTSSTLIKSRSNRRKLAGCAPALRAFAKAPRIKRLALLVAAHLLGDEVGGVRWVFRFLARDGWLVEEDAFQQALLDSGEEVPQDFAALFRSADLSGSGALNFVEFMAAMMATLPEVYCSHSSLKAVFHFFDSSGGGVIRGEQLHSLFPAKSESECSSMIRQSCGKDSMNFGDFQRVMLPMNWKPPVVAAASWAEVPDLSSPILVKKTSRESKHQARLGCSSDPEHDAPPQAIISRVTSAPSEAFAIRQVPGFHRTTLRPFYESQAVSNVVLGLASGSSGYARRAVQLNCAELVEAGRGAFFFMPNPKYHWTPEAAFNEERKARFVAWWIHPDLCPRLASFDEALAGAPAPSRRVAMPAANLALENIVETERGHAEQDGNPNASIEANDVGESSEANCTDEPEGEAYDEDGESEHARHDAEVVTHPIELELEKNALSGRVVNLEDSLAGKDYQIGVLTAEAQKLEEEVAFLKIQAAKKQKTSH